MKSLHWRSLAVSCALLGALVAASASGNTGTRGLEIATQADRRDAGFGDTAAVLAMTLYSSSGETTMRRMRARILETAAGDKRLIVFDEPGDVRGTAVLTHSHSDGSDAQWIFLPAIKRVKRIAGNSRTGPFMGSEFAYEDLASQELAKYTYEYLRDENCEGGRCYVIERIPADATSGYSRQLVWIDHEELRPWRVEYYDRKNSLLKVLSFEAYAQYKDQYWRAGRMTMHNVQTEKRTVIEWSDYRFGTGLNEAAFDPARLGDTR